MSSPPFRASSPRDPAVVLLERSKSPTRDFAKRILRYPSQQFRKATRSHRTSEGVIEPDRPPSILRQRHNREYSSQEVSQSCASDVSSDVQFARNPELKSLLDSLEFRLKSLYEERQALRDEVDLLSSRTARTEDSLSALQLSKERLVEEGINSRMNVEIERRNVKAQLDLAEIAKRVAEDDARAAKLKLQEQIEIASHLRRGLETLKLKVSPVMMSLRIV